MSCMQVINILLNLFKFKTNNEMMQRCDNAWVSKVKIKRAGGFAASRGNDDEIFSCLQASKGHIEDE